MQHTIDFEQYAIIAKEDIKQIEDALKEGNLADVASKVMENLQALENAPRNIAVTGESGSGKSTFINAIRGLGDEEPQSARTGVVETTVNPTPYSHPKHPNVTLWDLPGIGSPKFHPSTYLQQVHFSQYFFIIVACLRFKANHAHLASEIQRMGKHFYFVRSKVDVDLEATKKCRPRAYNEEGVLQQIREKCQECLKKEGVAAPQVFLLSSWELNKYDFMCLEETLAKELPSHKRHAFLLALPNISLEILQKKEALQKQIWKLAVVSCGVAAVPIPGLSEVCDIAILVKALYKYRENFGLDEDSLTNLAQKVSKRLEEIQGVIKSPLAKELSKNMVVKLVTNAGGVALKLLEHFACCIPLFGSIAAGGISFATTYYMLQSSLNELAEDAQNVLIKAFES